MVHSLGPQPFASAGARRAGIRHSSRKSSPLPQVRSLSAVPTSGTARSLSDTPTRHLPACGRKLVTLRRLLLRQRLLLRPQFDLRFGELFGGRRLRHLLASLVALPEPVHFESILRDRPLATTASRSLQHRRRPQRLATISVDISWQSPLVERAILYFGSWLAPGP